MEPKFTRVSMVAVGILFVLGASCGGDADVTEGTADPGGAAGDPTSSAAPGGGETEENTQGDEGPGVALAYITLGERGFNVTGECSVNGDAHAFSSNLVVDVKLEMASGASPALLQGDLTFTTSREERWITRDDLPAPVLELQPDRFQVDYWAVDAGLGADAEAEPVSIAVTCP